MRAGNSPHKKLKLNVLRLHRMGLTSQEIAKKYGMDTRAVSNILNKAGVRN